MKRAKNLTGLTLLDITLNHHTHDPVLSACNLLRQGAHHLGLVVVVLLGVSVAAVDHQSGPGPFLCEPFLCCGNIVRIVVRAPSAAAENHEAVLVTQRADDGTHAGLCEREKTVFPPGGLDRVDGDVNGAVGAVLEAHGERQAADQLAVQLRLRCARAHGADRQQIRQVLRRNGVEHLAGDGHAHLGQLDKHAPRDLEALVDLERAVDHGVVDQALPAHGRARFLEIRPHHDQQLAAVFLLQLEQSAAIVLGGIGVVDGAWPDNHQQTVVRVDAVDDGRCFFTARQNRAFGGRCLLDLVLEDIGGADRIVTANCLV